MVDAIALLALLIGLELVLGVDNVLVISIFVGRLPEEQRQKARIMGLAVAMLARIAMLWVVMTLANLTEPLQRLYPSENKIDGQSKLGYTDSSGEWEAPDKNQ